jgi:DNA-binding XRE family transcriptional regulator
MKTMSHDPEFNLRHTRTNVLAYTQEKLAEKLGVSVRTYIRYEKNNVVPPMVRRAIDSILTERGLPVIQRATTPSRTL